MPATEDLGLEEPVNVILATIKNCPIERENADLDLHYYRNIRKIWKKLKRLRRLI